MRRLSSAVVSPLADPPLTTRCRCVFLVLVGAIRDEHKSSVAGLLLEAEQKVQQKIRQNLRLLVDPPPYASALFRRLAPRSPVL